MENDEGVTALIYLKAEPIFTQLLSDQYGNYLSQKILEFCSDEQFDLLFAKVETTLSNLANEVKLIIFLQDLSPDVMCFNRNSLAKMLKFSLNVIHSSSKKYQQVHGTRAVQKFVEEGVKRSRSDKIMGALRDHVEPLSRSVTGTTIL